MNDLRNALALGREIAAGRLTAVKVLEAALARIESRDNEILAWKLINPEQALAEAMARGCRGAKRTSSWSPCWGQRRTGYVRHCHGLWFGNL